jgi:phosphoenolpyruvate phosphomutase
MLRRKLEAGEKIRLCEAHSGFSAQIAEASVSSNGRIFDGHWVSSLTSSASKGLPDMEMYVLERRLELIEEICFATTRPVVIDGDTGGDAATVEYLIQRLEILGASALVIEDKRIPKRNSLYGTNAEHLEDPEIFARKMARAKAALTTDDFLLFARLESLIAGAGVDDAIARARLYLEHGVDGIMIHSKSSEPTEVFAFLKAFEPVRKQFHRFIPLISVPTTYNSVTAADMFHRGFDIVVYANHLLRAAHKAMSQTCLKLLEFDRSAEIDSQITSVKEIFRQTGYLQALDRELSTIASGS